MADEGLTVSVGGLILLCPLADYGPVSTRVKCWSLDYHGGRSGAYSCLLLSPPVWYLDEVDSHAHVMMMCILELRIFPSVLHIKYTSTET